jgi:acyl-CoA synthetase (NDP forming)
MADYEAYKAGRRTRPEIPCEEKKLPCAGRMLEPEAMAWLRENGIPTPEFRSAPNVEEAVQRCREIGYPVVMKVVSPEIVHKSERGGVVLDIRDEAAARAAFDAIRRAAAGKDFRGVVICPMISDGQEVLMGITRDPQFGPVVALGLGGIYTEVLRDITQRIAPVDRAEAEAMIRELRSFPILKGIRGQAPRDLDALAETLVSFSRIPFRYPEIAEIDLNPVFVLSKGLIVGDVRVISKQNGQGDKA